MKEKTSLYEYYKLTESNDVPFIFKGALFHDALFQLGETIRDRMKSDERKKVKILSAFIELAQNIKLHSDEKVYSDSEKRDVGVGLIIYKEDENFFKLSAGNRVKKTDSEELKLKCEKINSLNRDELNKLYLQERNKSIEENRNGGSVGLIELARRSRNVLSVCFDEVDDHHSFFTIEVKVSKA
ncbi:MAG: SiaB family protein kinase [Bacteroidota bacterium]